jgi:hypothetical protein
LALCFSGGWFSLAAKMTSHNWAQFVMDWIGLPALALLAGILLYRRWYREFPFFCLYVIGAEVIGLVRLATSGLHSYLKIYWISDTFIAALAFFASYELFVKRLFPSFYKVRFYRILFPAIAILITGSATLNALFGGHFSILTRTIQVYEFLRATILFFFVGLMVLMGRRWDKQEFGIAFGFALDVAGSLAFIGIWTHTSNRSEALARWSVIAYDIACLIWLYCFWTSPKVLAPDPPAPLSPDALHEAKKWEETLKDFIATGKR